MSWLNDATLVTAEQKLQQQKEQLKQQAKTIRDKAIDSNITVFDSLWQVDSISEARMNRAITTASTLPPYTTVDWILADNTTRQTTADDLKSVLAAKAFREQDIFAQYTAWIESNTLSPFEVNL